MPINMQIEYPKLQSEVMKLRSQNDELVRLLTEASKHISRPMDISRFNKLSADISEILRKVKSNEY